MIHDRYIISNICNLPQWQSIQVCQLVLHPSKLTAEPPNWFTISNSAEITLNYATSNGSAEAETDYEEITGSITFTPNETSKSFNIGIVDDDIFELEESFVVNLSLAANSLGNASLGTIVDNSIQVTIADDDPAPIFAISGTSVSEEDGEAILTITKTNPVQMDVDVNYATADGTALAGLDYTSSNNSVTWIVWGCVIKAS